MYSGIYLKMHTKKKIIFVFLNQNICFVYSKESFQCDGSYVRAQIYKFTLKKFVYLNGRSHADVSDETIYRDSKIWSESSTTSILCVCMKQRLGRVCTGHYQKMEESVSLLIFSHPRPPFCCFPVNNT